MKLQVRLRSVAVSLLLFANAITAQPADDGTTSTPNTDKAEQPTQPNAEQNVGFDLASNPLLPSTCGLSQKITEGEKATLDEFPWLALLAYKKPTGPSTACTGALINNRYVLTAAQCLKAIPITWELQGVRLGEYNTETAVDCVKEDETAEVCADDPITVGIEEQISHEDYLPRTRENKNDIALVRLARNVTFTNYVKPICLPADDSLGVELLLAGWGRSRNTAVSAEKHKFSLPLVPADQCKDIYKVAGVDIGHGQMCAGGEKGKDACAGDSGGPLMAREQNADGTSKFTAVGVVSFGPAACGTEGWPSVYTRVYDFMPWILEKLKP